MQQFVQQQEQQQNVTPHQQQPKDEKEYQFLLPNGWMAYEENSFNKHKYKTNINNNKKSNSKKIIINNNNNINNIIKIIQTTFSDYYNHNQNNKNNNNNKYHSKITLHQLQSSQFIPLDIEHKFQKYSPTTTTTTGSLQYFHNHFRSIEKTLLPNNNKPTTASSSAFLESYTLGLQSLSQSPIMAIIIITLIIVINHIVIIKNYEDFTKNLESILIQLFIEFFLIYYNYLYLNLHRHRKSFRRKSLAASSSSSSSPLTSFSCRRTQVLPQDLSLFCHHHRIMPINWVILNGL